MASTKNSATAHTFSIPVSLQCWNAGMLATSRKNHQQIHRLFFPLKSLARTNDFWEKLSGLTLCWLPVPPGLDFMETGLASDAEGQQAGASLSPWSPSGFGACSFTFWHLFRLQWISYFPTLDSEHPLVMVSFFGVLLSHSLWELFSTLIVFDIQFLFFLSPISTWGNVPLRSQSCVPPGLTPAPLPYTHSRYLGGCVLGPCQKMMMNSVKVLDFGPFPFKN